MHPARLTKNCRHLPLKERRERAHAPAKPIFSVEGQELLFRLSELTFYRFHKFAHFAFQGGELGADFAQFA